MTARKAATRRARFTWTARRERFCLQYLEDLCAASAARRAGFSDAAARQRGHELMQRPEIRERIATLMAEREQATRVKGYKILEELAIVALSSLDHYEIDDDGYVTVRAGAPAGAIRAVSSIKRKRRTVTVGLVTTVEIESEIKLWDKGGRIADAMKHLGLLTDRVEHSADASLEAILAKSWQPPAAAGRGPCVSSSSRCCS